jgi:toxin YoeB
MKIIGFHSRAFDDYLLWQDLDIKKIRKINSLLKDILRNPFSGIGKPEKLKYQEGNFWSRRIDDENRIVYQVAEEIIIIISCKGHYK